MRIIAVGKVIAYMVCVIVSKVGMGKIVQWISMNANTAMAVSNNVSIHQGHFIAPVSKGVYCKQMEKIVIAILASQSVKMVDCVSIAAVYVNQDLQGYIVNL